MKNTDYIKAVKRGDRQAEIEMYNKQLSFRMTKIHESKKVYKRSKIRKQDALSKD